MRFTIFGGLFALLLALAGCAGSPKNEVVGEWVTTDTKNEKGELTMKPDGSFVLCGNRSGCFTGKYEVSEDKLMTTLEMKEGGAYTLCSPSAGCMSGKEKERLAEYKLGKTTLTVHHNILFSLPYGVAAKGTFSRKVNCAAEQKSAGRCTWIDINQLWRGGIFIKKG